MRRLLLWASAVFFACSATAAAQPPRTDGDWDVKIAMDMGGKPMELSSRQCVTKEQAADPMKALPTGPQNPAGCKLLDHKVVGQTMTFSMTCDGPAPIRTDAEFTYKGDTYTGTMTSASGGQKMVMRITGKRLGDCTTPGPATMTPVPPKR